MKQLLRHWTDAAGAAPAARALNLVSAGRTHAGLVRPLNEDRFLERPDIGLWAVADGMGGHQAGDVAASLAVETLGGVSAFGSAFAFLNGVRARLEDVNRELVARAAALPRGAVVGSTVAVLLVHDGHYACAWAGDSRVYRLRGGRLEQITRDHSLVQELVDGGALKPEEARTHKRRNVITRALGAADRLELDVSHGDVRPGDAFLLCTDGLTGVLGDDELKAVLGARAVEAAADRLLEIALERGATDNVTLVAVRVRQS